MLRPWFVPGRGAPNWHEARNRSGAAAVSHRMERRRGAVFLPKIGSGAACGTYPDTALPILGLSRHFGKLGASPVVRRLR